MSQEIVNALAAIVAERVEAANAVAEKISKTTGTVNKDAKDVRETSELPWLVEYRARVEKQQAAMLAEREAIMARIKAEVLKVESATPEEEEAAKEEYKTLAKAAREAMKAAKETATVLGLTSPEFPALLTLAGKERAAGSGTGTRRLRFAEVTVNGEKVKNLSAIASKIHSDTGVKVTAGDLQKALFAEAGTEDMSKISDVNFLWSETDKDGKTFSYDITAIREDGPDAGTENEGESTDSE